MHHVNPSVEQTVPSLTATDTVDEILTPQEPSGAILLSEQSPLIILPESSQISKPGSARAQKHLALARAYLAKAAQRQQ